MKICPKCQNKYTDETLNFCLQDGTQLIQRVQKINSEQATQFEQPEAETVISNRNPEKIQFDLTNKREEQNWEQSQSTNVSQYQDETRKSNTLIAVLLTAFGMLILFGIVGVGAYFYISSSKNEIAANQNVSGNENKKNENVNKNSEKETPTPKATPKKTATPTPKPTLDQNPEKTKKDVSDKIYTWKSMAEARNLNSYMNNYASRIDYYRKKRASKNFVRKDKERSFNKYTSIKSTFSNMDIKPSNDGKTAVVAFDKEWVFSNDTEQNSGKVRSQLKLKKVNDKWYITSEKDLKVYYVNK